MSGSTSRVFATIASAQLEPASSHHAPVERLPSLIRAVKTLTGGDEWIPAIGGKSGVIWDEAIARKLDGRHFLQAGYHRELFILSLTLRKLGVMRPRLVAGRIGCWNSRGLAAAGS